MSVICSRMLLLVIGASLAASAALSAEEPRPEPSAGQEPVVIEDGKTVVIEYTLKLDDGTLIDSNLGEDPLSYEQGARQILPALEQALAGLSVDDTKNVRLSAAEGYGEVDPQAFREVSPELIPEEARVPGHALLGQDAEGNQFRVRVHEVGEETIVLDFNHPLAGQSLTFDVRIVDIR